MKANNEINSMYIERLTFIETLSREFVDMTGYGVYVFLNPLDIDQLFDKYLNLDIPIRTFARQCIKNLM
jgi:hypothetical protein